MSSHLVPKMRVPFWYSPYIRRRIFENNPCVVLARSLVAMKSFDAQRQGKLSCFPSTSLDDHLLEYEF